MPAAREKKAGPVVRGHMISLTLGDGSKKGAGVFLSNQHDTDVRTQNVPQRRNVEKCTMEHTK